MNENRMVSVQSMVHHFWPIIRGDRWPYKPIVIVEERVILSLSCPPTHQCMNREWWQRAREKEESVCERAVVVLV